MKHIVALLFFALSCTAVGYSQGRLEKAEGSFKKEKKEKHTQNSRRSRSESSDSSFAADVAGSIISGLFAGIAEGISESIEEHREENPKPKKWLTKYPYYNSEKGDFSLQQGEDTREYRFTLSNRLVVVDSKLYGSHYEGLFRFSNGALEIDYLQLWEKNKNFGNNSLGITTMVLHMPFWNGEVGSSSIKLGTTYIDGEIEEWGFTIGMNIELFLGKPLSHEIRWQGSFFEDDREIWNATTLLNYYNGRWKFSGGFEYLKIGEEDFYMPTVGIGISL